MFVPLTIRDHLERARLVYGNRIGIFDEPNQPAEPLANLTYGEFAAKAKAMAKGFEELGVEQGGRVAIVSHNASRLLTFLFGTAAWGRVGVPINFRLNHEEISYIIKHCGAEILLVDPELRESLQGIEVKHFLHWATNLMTLFLEMESHSHGILMKMQQQLLTTPVELQQDPKALK